MLANGGVTSWFWGQSIAGSSSNGTRESDSPPASATAADSYVVAPAYAVPLKNSEEEAE